MNPTFNTLFFIKAKIKDLFKIPKEKSSQAGVRRESKSECGMKIPSFLVSLSYHEKDTLRCHSKDELCQCVPKSTTEKL